MGMVYFTPKVWSQFNDADIILAGIYYPKYEEKGGWIVAGGQNHISYSYRFIVSWA